MRTKMKENWWIYWQQQVFEKWDLIMWTVLNDQNLIIHTRLDGYNFIRVGFSVKSDYQLFFSFFIFPLFVHHSAFDHWVCIGHNHHHLLPMELNIKILNFIRIGIIDYILSPILRNKNRHSEQKIRTCKRQVYGSSLSLCCHTSTRTTLL